MTPYTVGRYGDGTLEPMLPSSQVLSHTLLDLVEKTTEEIEQCTNDVEEEQPNQDSNYEEHPMIMKTSLQYEHREMIFNTISCGSMNFCKSCYSGPLTAIPQIYITKCTLQSNIFIYFHRYGSLCSTGVR